MSFLKSSPRASLFILLVPVLLASKCKDKDKNKDKELEDTAVEVAAPTITLQVASVDPNRVWIGEPSTAVVYGSGFVDGARVDTVRFDPAIPPSASARTSIGHDGEGGTPFRGKIARFAVVNERLERGGADFTPQLGTIASGWCR